MNDPQRFSSARPVKIEIRNPRIIIAIDGHSGCGKSTTAKKVASHLGYIYVDTGAMYRAVTLYFLRNHISFTDLPAIDEALATISISFQFNPETNGNEIHLNGVNVENEIRKLEIANAVPVVSAIPAVRRMMVAIQQKLGRNRGIVMDGRDIGTKVFPEAELKIFMTADALIRAERRQLELQQKGEVVALAEILENIRKRDHLDTTRAESPLRQASDAELLDTSFMTIDEQVRWVVRACENRIELVTEPALTDLQYEG
ncbi:(d)CMP kinase [Larkinella terrae]|uniref:Cytidylate kinase n=1 Tax=Larkinella terrae TaxID=2025311 RepID=A0A7K0EGZ2_9BACT|nr:(d)CMP kinase [Larkinella terrae]MRS60841.1 (d)CMP kinase [Larkinella terrae]